MAGVYKGNKPEHNAASSQVAIMKHNREHPVFMSAQGCRRSKQRDRQVFRIGEISEEVAAAIAAAIVPAEAAAFDREVDDEKLKGCVSVRP